MVTLDFQPDAGDHVAAARLYDKNSGWARADRVVALVLFRVGAGGAGWSGALLNTDFARAECHAPWAAGPAW
mgnify:CR=1 FL=1